MTSAKFQCEACGGIFQQAWSNEEALKEMKDSYGDISEDDRMVICHTCYQKLQQHIAEFRPQPPFEQFRILQGDHQYDERGTESGSGGDAGGE